MTVLPNEKLATPTGQNRASAGHNPWLKAFDVYLDYEATFGKGKLRQVFIESNDGNPDGTSVCEQSWRTT
jgi:hypothetical protein